LLISLLSLVHLRKHAMKKHLPRNCIANDAQAVRKDIAESLAGEAISPSKAPYILIHGLFKNIIMVMVALTKFCHIIFPNIRVFKVLSRTTARPASAPSVTLFLRSSVYYLRSTSLIALLLFMLWSLVD
jgi:hypothetical protein